MNATIQTQTNDKLRLINDLDFCQRLPDAAQAMHSIRRNPLGQQTLAALTALAIQAAWDGYIARFNMCKEIIMCNSGGDDCYGEYNFDCSGDLHHRFYGEYKLSDALEGESIHISEVSKQLFVPYSPEISFDKFIDVNIAIAIMNF